MKLDKADKKILLELIKNARAPVSVIAKNTRLSREIVNYRISKLEENNIITGYVARVNQSLFGSGIALMLCRLVKSNNIILKNIESFIHKNPNINWAIETCGNYDIALTILYDDPHDLAGTINTISNFIGKNLKEHEIYLYIEEYKFDRSGLLDEKIRIDRKIIAFQKQKMPKVDSKDLHLLSILSKNCKIKNIELSKEVKISEDVVRLRIKNLEKQNVILGYTLSINTENLGYEAYQLFIQMENFDKQTINKIKYYAQTTPYIVFCSRISGKYNIIMNIHARNRKHFNEIFIDIKNTFPELIDYQFQLNMRTIKEVFVPPEKIFSTLVKH